MSVDASTRVNLHGSRSTAPGAKRVHKNRPVVKSRWRTEAEPFDATKVTRDPRLAR